MYSRLEFKLKWLIINFGGRAPMSKAPVSLKGSKAIAWGNAPGKPTAHPSHPEGVPRGSRRRGPGDPSRHPYRVEELEGCVFSWGVAPGYCPAPFQGVGGQRMRGATFDSTRISDERLQFDSFSLPAGSNGEKSQRIRLNSEPIKFDLKHYQLIAGIPRCAILAQSLAGVCEETARRALISNGFRGLYGFGMALALLQR